MTLNRVGFIGWRGIVGSVLLKRMIEEGDFFLINEPTFFSSSQLGMGGPDIGVGPFPLFDAKNFDKLKTMEVILTCQGEKYTKAVHHKLRQYGWKGYWIDAASTLRMAEQSTIILDPINMPAIEKALSDEKKDFIGGNCTVSLMLMALDGLFDSELIEWISVMTYQAISGGGSRKIREFIAQMGQIYENSKSLLNNTNSSILEIDQNVINTMRSGKLETSSIGYPLAGNLLPWIDKDFDSGTSVEEWKGSAETNKILERSETPIPIDSICIRVGTMRCHSQAFTIKLKENIPLKEIENIIDSANDWVSVIENQKSNSLSDLTPSNVTGTLRIPVGRIRKLHIGNHFLSAFTVGDQLLWGAAEPLRRMLKILSNERHFYTSKVN